MCFPESVKYVFRLLSLKFVWKIQTRVATPVLPRWVIQGTMANRSISQRTLQPIQMNKSIVQPALRLLLRFPSSVCLFHLFSSVKGVFVTCYGFAYIWHCVLIKYEIFLQNLQHEYIDEVVVVLVYLLLIPVIMTMFRFRNNQIVFLHFTSSEENTKKNWKTFHIFLTKSFINIMIGEQKWWVRYIVVVGEQGILFL